MLNYSQNPIFSKHFFMRMSLLMLFLLHFTVYAQECNGCSKGVATKKAVVANVIKKTTIFSLKEKINYTKGRVVTLNVTKDKGSSVILLAFDKDQQLGCRPPFDVMIQVLEGKVKVNIAGKPFEVKEGKVLIIPANTMRTFYATEAFKMVATKIRE